MPIKSKVRDNIALNAHAEGCAKNVSNQIQTVKKHQSLNTPPLNVLIIGGSSGYGLASRIALAFGAGAYTYNVCFERPAKGRNTASAGYYNNQAFKIFAKEDEIESDDLNADAFSFETKEEVIQAFKKKGKKIDLIIYSLASGMRIDPYTQEKYVSALKPVGENFEGLSVDIKKEELKKETIQRASKEEIQNTIKVMGGEDYLLWIRAIDQANMFNENAKALTYTYVGSRITYPIYKDGTIGHAKRNLEEKNNEVQEIMNKYNGKAYISSSKTVVTKASVFIPTVALYASALFKVMKENGTHESIIDHKIRLFEDYIFNKDKKETFIHLDQFELEDKTQEAVEKLLDKVESDEDLKLVDFDFFKKEFMNLSGFDMDGIDYQEK